MMRTYLIYTLLGLFCFSMGINAQEIKKKSKHRVGINTTFLGGSEVFLFESLEGDASIDGKEFYSFGMSYTYILSKRVELQSGIEFSRHKISITPTYSGEEFDHSPWDENIKQLTIPLTLNVNLGKYFFFNGGFLLDFEVSKKNSINEQTGLGTVLGIGVKYDFDPGVSIFANPYYKLHTLIPLPLSSTHQRMQEYGIKIGANYNF